MNQLDIALETKRAGSVAGTVVAYIQATKPRETSLLTVIGLASAAIAPGGPPSAGLLFAIFFSVLLASAGVNGLTCYLDRDWDAKMARTKQRPLPSRRIYPAWHLLPFVLGLTCAGLALGFLIHPLVALAGALGTLTAVIARKTWITHYLGIVSSLAPIWMGWLAVYRGVDGTIIAISIMVAIWVLIHVWSLMLAYRRDYLDAGLHIFPVTASVEASVRWIVALSICLAVATLGIYAAGSFGALFGASALALSVYTLIASAMLAVAKDKKSAWRLYKFSAFPFLGLVFLMMVLDRLA